MKFLVVLAIASVVTAKLGFHVGRGRLPILQLDYASYRADSYDKKSDTYLWKNIRFAAPAIGNLRWAKPALPAVVPEVQERPRGATCVQQPLQVPIALPKGRRGRLLSQFTEHFFESTDIVTNEDCLFLDVTVPAKVLTPTNGTLLPVVMWLYGGAYAVGSKDLFYHFGPLSRVAQGNAIWVVPNYRVGAFGFLAGSTVEQEGIPNAGLHDQVAALEWVQKYIRLLGGNPDDVNLWGESAGGGSIVQHLVWQGGKNKLLFKRALIESPAVLQYWDRNGTVEDEYRRFELMAGCAGRGLACLRSVNTKALERANSIAGRTAPLGAFPFGPTTDGVYLPASPAVLLAQGNFHKDLESVIVSHVADEAQVFYPRSASAAQTINWVQTNFPRPDAAVLIDHDFDKVYPPTTVENDRMKDVFRDVVFTCNDRYVAEAYPGRAWAVEYGAKPYFHSADTDAMFSKLPYKPEQYAFMSYLTSHALTGNPNTLRMNGTVEWPLANASTEFIGNTLMIDEHGTRLMQDEQVKKARCDFWRELIKLMG